MKDLVAKLRIEALVKGLEDIAAMTCELQALAAEGDVEIPDNTQALREGAQQSSGALKDTAGAAAEVGSESAAAAGGADDLRVALGKLAAAGAGLVALAASLKSISTEAMHADTRGRKLEAVVRATGGAAGLTAEEIRKLSSELALATLGSVEGFENAAAALLTFKTVSGEAFERALELSQDLAEVMGGDAKSAAMQLGKALEDPERGLTALTRAGVSFSEAEQRLIKDLVEVGRLAEAQGIILDKVAGQVGGVAREMAGGLAGALDTVAQRWEELKVKSGDALQPALIEIAQKLAGVLELLADNIEVVAAVSTVAGVGALTLLARTFDALRGAMLAAVATHKTHAAAAGANAAATTAAAAQITAAANLIRKAGLVAASGWVGWEVGTRLKEEFLEVELFGIALAAGLHKAAVRAQGAWEMMKAPFTDDTVEAAYDRMQRKLQEVETGYAELADDAIAARNKIGSAARQTQQDVEQAVGGMLGAFRGLLADGSTDALAAKLNELSAQQLTDFGADAEAAFRRGAISATELRAALDGQVRVALTRLGVDADQALGGMSAAFTESAGALDVLIGQLGRLRERGVDTGALLTQAFSGALGAASTAREIEHLTRLIDGAAKSGQLAGAQLEGMLDAVRTRAQGVTAEVARITAEIAELQRRAANVRAGLAGAGAQAQARRDRGLSDGERDDVNAARAKRALDEASRYATFAQNAALDGRAEKAQEYARQAADLIERAATAANAIGDDDTAARLLDQVAEAQARELEAQAAVKKQRSDEIEQKNAEQAAALTELEGRLQKIAEGATVTVRADTTAADQALAAVQAAVNAIPAERTITVRTVYVSEGGGSGSGGSLADELSREATRSGSRR